MDISNIDNNDLQLLHVKLSTRKALLDGIINLHTAINKLEEEFIRLNILTTRNLTASSNRYIQVSALDSASFDSFINSYDNRQTNKPDTLTVK